MNSGLNSKTAFHTVGQKWYRKRWWTTKQSLSKRQKTTASRCC